MRLTTIYIFVNIVKLVSSKNNDGTTKMDTIHISTFHCPPFMILSEEMVPLDGIEYQILQYLTRGHKKVVYNTSQAINVNQYWKIASDIVNNVSEIASCSLYLKHSTDYDTTVEHSMSCLTFLVPKPKIKEINLTTASLTIKTCAITIGTVLLITCIFKIFSKCLHCECDFVKCLIDIWRILLAGSIVMPYLTRISPILLISWYFFSILMVTGSSTGITTKLTSVTYTERVKTVEDLIDKGIHWGDYGGDYSDGNQNLVSLREQVSSRKDSMSRLANGNYAILAKRIGNDYVTDTELIDDTVRKKLVVMQECFKTNELVFFIRKNCCNLKKLNWDISKLKEHGFVRYWYDMTLLKYADRSIMQSLFVTNYHTNAVPLKLKKFQGIFQVLFIAHGFSFLVFLLELLIGRNQFNWTN